MKNIHVLPTDKPSRLHITYKLDLYPNGVSRKPQGLCKNQNIYITTDENIKEGDWLFANQGANKIVEIKEGNYPYGSINNKGDKIFNSKHWKSKIILTTDQDLIADGVQAIDDEFLEWFGKNPTCEKVEVNKIELNTDYRSDWKQKFDYIIIIPQEEPKYIEDDFEMKLRIINKLWDEESKQETLEEDDLDSIENKIIKCLNKADDKLNANDFNRLAESIIDYIDEISRNKRC